MATPEQSASGTEGGSKGSGIGVIIGVLLASALAGGGGVFLGASVLARPQPAVTHADGAAKPEGKYTDGSKLVALQPMTTNLAGMNAAWIRIEASAVLKADAAVENEGTLAATLSEDIVSYLRTVPLSQVEGASGFQNLREDLDERVRIRSDGAVKELIIQSLVIE